ncbi:type VI secretion system lipoprotein TssJ [Enterobacter asburiae]|nr:type VI secretion system lipoprotein TssJ [Enterobacter asburiae]
MHKITSLVLTATLLGGCAAAPSAITTPEQAIAQVSAPFSQGAITLEVQTSPDLNALEGIANSCTLLVIQAQHASTLNKLLSSPARLKSLFSAAGAQDEILKVDRYAAMPGQSTTLHIDRNENTRYVAIVAGYYPFPQKQHMVLVAVPVTTESQGWWHPTWKATLSPLNLSLLLGTNSINKFSGATQEPVSFTQNDITPSGKGG